MVRRWVPWRVAGRDGRSNLLLLNHLSLLLLARHPREVGFPRKRVGAGRDRGSAVRGRSQEALSSRHVGPRFGRSGRASWGVSPRRLLLRSRSRGGSSERGGVPPSRADDGWVGVDSRGERFPPFLPLLRGRWLRLRGSARWYRRRQRRVESRSCVQRLPRLRRLPLSVPLPLSLLPPSVRLRCRVCDARAGRRPVKVNESVFGKRRLPSRGSSKS